MRQTPTPPSPAAEPGLRVASWNIHKGIGADRRRDLMRTADVLVEIAPDIIALQEADLRFGDRAGLLDLDHLHQESGMVPVPVGTPGPSHGWHGNLILLRKGIAITQVHRVTLPGLEPRGALIADLSVAGHGLRIVATHLGLLRTSRLSQVHALSQRLDQMDPLPTLLMGDLNEWRNGPASPLAHFSHRFRAAPPVRSFPARFPVLTLDRMLVAGGDVHEMRTHDTALSRRASDHLPIKGRLVLHGRA
ncbi:MAG: hypothetical protein RIT14_2544 [Pseudomonadota bacterium]